MLKSHNEFFDNLEELVEKFGPIPPESIYNYDETNQTDDPGCKKCLYGVDGTVLKMLLNIQSAPFQRRGAGMQSDSCSHRWLCTAHRTSTKSGKQMAFLVRLMAVANVDGLIPTLSNSGLKWFLYLMLKNAKGSKSFLVYFNPDVVRLTNEHQIYCHAACKWDMLVSAS